MANVVAEWEPVPALIPPKLLICLYSFHLNIISQKEVAIVFLVSSLKYLEQSKRYDRAYLKLLQDIFAYESEPWSKDIEKNKETEKLQANNMAEYISPKTGCNGMS